jgi:hypothetical protein
MVLSAVLFNCIIFNIIKKYLLHDMLRCLADTCTDLRQYKFEYIMILNNDISKLYYNDNLFRQTILDYRRKMKAKYPQFRFGLNLRQLQLDCSVNKLHDIFKDVYYVDLTDTTELIDITPLKGIPIVRLTGCPQLANIGILSHIGHKKDLSLQMINLNYVQLDWSYITDDEYIVVQKKNYVDIDSYWYYNHYIIVNSFISLAYCHSITDFSSLKDIMYVDLRGCSQITNSDLIHFSNTKILNLSGCYLITDISVLSHLEALNISNCEYIMDASPLSKLSTLILSGCDSIRDVSALGNIKNLDLSSCRNIYDFSALGKVKKLNLSYCSNISNLSDLINVDDLDLSGCDITDIPPFNSRRLNLSNCHKITDFSKLTNVKELLFRHCKQIKNKDVPFFVNKDFLDLTGCTNITNVDILLDNVKVLDLSWCTGITDLSPFADDGITALDRYYIRKLK